MSHVTRMNESCRTHMNESCQSCDLRGFKTVALPVTFVWMSHVTYMPHMWMSHVTCMYGSCHMSHVICIAHISWPIHTCDLTTLLHVCGACVIWHATTSMQWQSLASFVVYESPSVPQISVNGSHHTYESVTSHTWMNLVMHTNQSYDNFQSCQLGGLQGSGTFCKFRI